jgi:outer membrane protein TolC
MGIWYRSVATSFGAAITLCFTASVLGPTVAAAESGDHAGEPAPLPQETAAAPELDAPAIAATEAETNAMAVEAIAPAEATPLAQTSTPAPATVDGTDDNGGDPFPEVDPVNDPANGGEPAGDRPSDSEPKADPEPAADPAPEPNAAPTVTPGPDLDPLRDVPPVPATGGPDRPERLPQPDRLNLLDDDAIAPMDPRAADLDRFESNPNPLQFPTLPEEVEILLRQPLTLEQSLEIGRRNSRTLKDARLAIERSRYALRQALAANYPQLRLNANLTQSLGAGNRLSTLISNRQLRRAGQGDQQRDPQSQLSANANLELSYNIYTSGQRPANIHAAQLQLRADELAFEALYEDVKFDITDRYYQLQQENAQLEIDQSAVSFREQSVRDAEALERAGLGTRFEVLQAQVELANDRQQVVQTRDRQTQRRRDLARILSLPQQIDLQTAEDIAKAADWGLTLEESIVLAYRNRAELERQLALMDINDAQRRAVLAQLGPQVSAFGRFELLDVLSPSDDFGPVDGYAVGLQMQWLLYDGGAVQAAARQQEINREREANRFAQIREQIRFDVERSHSNLKANEENIRTALQAIEAAREEVRLARLRFQAGVGTQTDRLNAETRLTRARGNVLFAVVGYNRALAALRRAVTNLPDGVLQPPAEPLDLPALSDFGPDSLTPSPGAGASP